MAAVGVVVVVVAVVVLVLAAMGVRIVRGYERIAVFRLRRLVGVQLAAARTDVPTA